MVSITVNVGPKGQIVIPKMIRDSLGILENKTVTLEIKDKTVELKRNDASEILKEWRDKAKKEGVNVSKEWIYGDRLYEEEFG